MTEHTTLQDTAPGQLRVIKRDGKVAPFTADKISVALFKAFYAVEGPHADESSRVRAVVPDLTQSIAQVFNRRLPSGGSIHIEDIQDQVELALMRAGEHSVAREYVLYRNKRAQERQEQSAAPQSGEQQLQVKSEDGSLKPLDSERLSVLVGEACMNLDDVDPELVLAEAKRALFEGIDESDVGKSLVMAARTLVEKEPNYTYVTARLLMDQLRAEALNRLGVAKSATQADMARHYPAALAKYLKLGVSLELLDERLIDAKRFDIDALGKALLPKGDLQFTYLGLQTLYDRYFIHHEDVRLELPQVFFMRIAMGLAVEDDNPTARAIEFYRLLSSFDYMSSTPTLFNAGTRHPQLSSCYLTSVPDDLYGIYGAIQDNAMLSKFAGGLGNDWTPVRSLGAHIKGTNGKSQGVVPFLKVANDTAVAVNQGGKRKGAVCAYLETWHMDIEEFLDLRKNTGDDRRRTHDMNTAHWVPDLFMKRVFSEGRWTLFSPSDVPDLHDLYGAEFEARYEHYEQLAAEGKIPNHKSLPALDLWRRMLGMLFETGHPWITFKDACNLRSPQQHDGVVHSSNLCTEITLNSKPNEEIAVCNLGSVNLAQHICDGKLDSKKLARTVETAVRMLDNVIDINYYPVEAARASNMRHRPIGLGVMGFQDALYRLGIPYGSDRAVAFADVSMEHLSYYAIRASSALASDRGSYSSFEGSLWSEGILPIHSLDKLATARGGDYLDMDRSQTLDWDLLRTMVKGNGMRNSNVMAIAPTATIANITGVSQSIEPTYQNLFVKSNLSGEFTVVNPYMVRDLKTQGLWDNVMVNDLKFYEGSLQQIDRIPDEIKALYATAFEVEPKWIVEAASRRQKWLDQAQSLNIYIAGANGKKLDLTYRMAWLRGLKTTYYLRALSATSTEKSTVTTGALNAVSNQAPAPVADMPTPVAGPAPVPAACSIDNPDCEACT